MPNPTTPGAIAAVFDRSLHRGVTYRTYGDRGQHKRPMVHRWPSSKIRGSIPITMALPIEIYDTSPLMRRLLRVPYGGPLRTWTLGNGRQP